LEIPHQQLTVITGVSGSGKSSLAFDTLYAEGQRQYIESLSTYARQYLNQLPTPDVDSIEGLQPTLCIDQRVAIANPRSTVATITEVYDYLRLLMARTGTPHCCACGQPIIQQSSDQILSTIGTLPEGTKLVLLAPMVRGRRGAHRDVFSAIQKAGLVRVRVDNELVEIDSVPELAVRKNHTIEAVVDKIVVRPDNQKRLADSLATTLRLADGLASISYLTPCNTASDQPNQWTEQFFSTRYACAACGTSIEEIEPRTFSFNSPYGACPACDGLGQTVEFDSQAIVSDWRSCIDEGAICVLTGAPGSLLRQLRPAVAELISQFSIDATTPLSKLKSADRSRLFSGMDQSPGLIKLLNQYYSMGNEKWTQWLESFRSPQPCSTCNGSRLRREAMSVTVAGQSIADICRLSINECLPWLEKLELPANMQQIARPILAGMLHRLRFLVQSGVGYLTLHRSADSLSGGELQRVRLATSIGSGLVGVCYILDEPSIGLHQCDNDRLIQSLRDLQRQGNTVIVVEHDEAMMRAADLLVDMGPGAGQQGGQIVAQGTPKQVEKNSESLTGAYLSGRRRVSQQRQSRSPRPKQEIRLSGARLNNLQNVNLQLPLGLLVGITGVSGSGKSSLITRTLLPAIKQQLTPTTRQYPGPFQKLDGVQHLDKLIELSQAPIGRTPRSTPATYCGIFDLIRSVWANTREAKSKGYTASRFSFNSGNGRCQACQGQGQEKIEMNFLPDLFVTCSVCNGLRYNRQTLQVRYRERSIADVLRMSIDEAADFFQNFQKIDRSLRTLQQVGLGYLSLGQSSSTLSGGEAQRIKLATELARPSTSKTIYFLDEPTTGLHFEDVRRLIAVLNGLADLGNSVVVIEHNLDVIRSCDWLIDMGPGGGSSGGQIIAAGPPSQISAHPSSVTGRYL
jgi:excinuclease ABC subunit A